MIMIPMVLMIPTRFEDSCGVYYPFQKERNIPVECNSDESHTPGMRTKRTTALLFSTANVFMISNVFIRHFLCKDCETGAPWLHL